MPGHPGNVLMRHFTNQGQADHVFIFTDNTVGTELKQPSDPTADPWGLVSRVFRGSGTYVVSDAEAALLTSAGYVVDP